MRIVQRVDCWVLALGLGEGRCEVSTWTEQAAAESDEDNQ